jgi:hypothetical protein
MTRVKLISLIDSGLPHGRVVELDVVAFLDMLLGYNAKCITLGVQSLV